MSFKFNGISDIELGLYTKEIYIPPATKKKIKVDVPYMHSSYDFSTVATNGEIVYSDTNISIKCILEGSSEFDIQNKYNSIINKIVDVGKCELIRDTELEYVYFAECEGDATLNYISDKVAEVTINFVANPIKKSNIDFGHDVWDVFNFEEDKVDTMSYEVDTTKEISIYNPTRSIVPLIICSAAMTIIKDGITYNFSAGENKRYDFKLVTGENTCKINGTGTIQIVFKKERV